MAVKEKSSVGRTVAIMSGLGSFIMSIIAVVGIVVYQTNSNTELKTEVRYMREELPELRRDIKEQLASLGLQLRDTRKEIQSEITDRLRGQDKRIVELQKEVNDLQVRVKVLESLGE